MIFTTLGHMLDFIIWYSPQFFIITLALIMSLQAFHALRRLIVKVGRYGFYARFRHR